VVALSLAGDECIRRREGCDAALRQITLTTCKYYKPARDWTNSALCIAGHIYCRRRRGRPGAEHYMPRTSL